ncbi:MAG: hypothetical protein B6D61_08375 [Bacteroidetes bacterium 4484_249]|nr:MAG: hypothetical protein B6D61_08375 [Bacteroidetes bacterium 4484_249]
MKTKITLFIQIFLVMISITTLAQDSIPNNNFEYWNAIHIPKYWETTNIFLPPGITTVIRTTDSYEGDYAMKLQTINIDSILVPGVATLGHVGMGYTYGGTPFAHKPTAINGYIKHLSNDDEVFISVQFYKNGNEIGGGVWSTTDSIGEYSEFTAPISFSSSEIPDTMNITILTDPDKEGSTLFIDNLSLTIQTGLNENCADIGTNVYPNPTSGYLNINPSFNFKYDYFLYDMNGNKTFEKTGVEGKQEVLFNNEKPGIYSLHIISADKKYMEQKMIILSK